MEAEDNENLQPEHRCWGWSFTIWPIKCGTNQSLTKVANIRSSIEFISKVS